MAEWTETRCKAEKGENCLFQRQDGLGGGGRVSGYGTGRGEAKAVRTYQGPGLSRKASEL